jgi:RNA polymerase sigma-70 factor (sigma-E family)
LLGFAYLLVGDRAIAQELTQEAFIRSFARFRDLHSERALGLYLRRTLVNLSRNHFRRAALERRLGSIPGPTAVQRSPDVDEHLTLVHAVRRLPPRQRTVIVLRYFEDMTEAQMAEVMDTSIPAIKSLLQRALRRLREEGVE